MKWCKVLLVAAVLAASSVYAQPLGPTTLLPGFDAEQSRMVYEEGSRILGEAQRRFGSGLGIKTLAGRALMCGLAQTMRGVVEAAAFQQGSGLSPAQVSGARKAVDYLRDVEAKNCDRPSGGGMGTGNEGDKVIKAFFDAYAPRARNIVEEVRDKLSAVFTSDAARIARDAMLAAIVVTAGLATAPLWAT